MVVAADEPEIAAAPKEFTVACIIMFEREKVQLCILAGNPNVRISFKVFKCNFAFLISNL